jgi:16S rRNA (guanine1516-N2)-methyltransferase
VRDERPIVSDVDGRLEARWPGDRPGTGVASDFSSVSIGGKTALARMPLVRACGLALARDGARLVDATAGLGYDSFVLARAGFAVTAFERHPAVASLLEDGLRRAGHPFALRRGNAIDALSSLQPDVVYLDPMFPPKRRSSALPPKDMQIVRALVGDDPDVDRLFAAACAASPRVVVKRPTHADPMRAGNAEPTSSIEGKLARFDVYLTRR